MTKTPEKPLVKSSTTTEVWTKSADNRIARIEKRVENIEKHLTKMVEQLKRTQSSAGSYGYSIRKNS